MSSIDYFILLKKMHYSLPFFQVTDGRTDIQWIETMLHISLCSRFKAQTNKRTKKKKDDRGTAKTAVAYYIFAGL